MSRESDSRSGSNETTNTGLSLDGVADDDRRRMLRMLGTVPVAAAAAGCGGGGGGGGDGGDGGGGGGGGDGGDGGGGDGGGGGSGDLAGRGPDDFGDVVELKIDAPKLQNIPDIMRELGNTWDAELGVEFNVETTSWGTYLSMVWIEQGHDQVAWTFFGGSPERVDPQFFLSVPTSGMPMNVSSFSDEEYDAMYDKYISTYGRDAKNKIAEEMQAYWHENIVSPINTAWPTTLLPHNSTRWNLTKTKTIGVHTAGTMSIIKAEPQSDDVTTLRMGGAEVNQRPNVVAPTANAMDWLFRSVYDTCVRMNFEGEFEPWALESMERIDKTTFDLTLREGMNFHDGESLTAEDLKFTFDFLSSYSFGKIDQHVEPIDSVSAETDLTVRVNLSNPWSTFETSTLVYAWILPAHIWEDVPDQVDQPVNWKQEVGDDPPGDWAASGPLQVRSVGPDNIELEAYDDHFSGFPNYEELTYERLGSPEAIRSNLVNGEIDMPMQAPSVPVAQQAAKQGDDIENAETNALLTWCYSFNTTAAPGDDLTFRKAARATTPSDKIIDVYRRGAGIPSDSTYIHPEHPWGMGRDDLATMQEMWDPEGARQMLEDEGYAWDDQGRLRYPADK